MVDPDLELVHALQAGDDTALNSLMDRYREPLHRFLSRYTGNQSVGQDLAQEAFVRAYFNIRSFRPKAKFSTWLFQIAVNLARDRSRSKAGKNAANTVALLNPAESSLMATAETPARRLELTEDVARVQAAIAELPHVLRAPLVLTVLEDKSHIEAADILKISPKAVESRIYRARRVLLDALGGVG